jgi:hypothetical protein
VADVDELLRRNLLEVFGERDGDRRRAAMAAVLGADVLFQDPEGAVRGRDAVETKVAALLADAPGFVFRLTGPVRVSGDLGVLTWGFGPEDGTPVVTGPATGLVDGGLIVRLQTLLDEPGGGPA